MKKLTYLALVVVLLPFAIQAQNWVDVPTNDNTLIVQVDKDSIQKINYNGRNVVSGWQRATTAATWHYKEYVKQTGQEGQWVNMLVYTDCKSGEMAVKQGTISDYDGHTLPIKSYKDPKFEQPKKISVYTKNFFCKYN